METLGLANLLSLGFCEHLPLFIRNLLVNRTYGVRVGDTFSLSFDQVEGVPQGSVLSVLCLALAINDIVTTVADRVSCTLYVDDFILYLSGSALPSAVRLMQLAINRVTDWTILKVFVFLWRNLTLSFSVVHDVYFQNLLLPSMVVFYLWFVSFVFSV